MLDQLEQRMGRLNQLERAIRVPVVVDDRIALQQITLVQTQIQHINNLTARAKIEVDTTQAESKLDGLMSRVQRGIASGVGAAIGFEATRGIGAAANAIVDYTGKLEQARVAYTSLLGSTRAADEFLASLQKFAASTPFDYEQVNRYAQRLIATGTAANQVIPTLTALGNAIAATGQGQEALDHVTLALSQMRNSVHASAQDFNQLTQAQINGYAILAEQMGITEAQVRKMTESGQITGEQAARGVIEGLARRNVGLMEQQSKTFLGRLENFEDNFRQDMSKIGRPIFDELSAGLVKASDALASPKFQQFASDTVHDLTDVVHAGEAVAGTLSKIPLPVIESAIHLGELAVAIKTVSVAVEFGTGLLGLDTAAKVANTAATEADTTAVLANNAARAKGASGPLGRAGALGGGLLAAGGPAIAIGEGLGTYPKVLGDLRSGDIRQAFGDFIKNAPGTPTGALSLITGMLGIPNPLNGFGTGGSNDLGQRLEGGKGIASLFGSLTGQAGQNAPAQLSQLIAGVKTGAITADQARGSFDLLERTFGRFVPDIATVRAAFEAELTPAIEDQKKQMILATSAGEQYRASLSEIGKYQFAGATNESILRGVLGITGTGDQATSFQKQQAQKELADLLSAYQQAGQAAGSVDITKGIAGLAQQSDALRKAQAALGRSGVGNTYLDSLTSMAATFKQITDAEDRATAAMKGFDLTLSVTKGYMSDIGGLKSDFIAALDAAEKRRAAGIADQSDLDIINAAPDAIGKLDSQMGKLQQHANADIIGKINNLTDYADLDKYTRNIVDRLGGGRQVALTVQSNVADIKQTIDDIVNQPHEATITLDLAMAAGAASHLPPWVIKVLANIAEGGSATIPGAEGGGEASAPPASGAAIPSAANPVGWNQFQALSQSQFSSIVAEGAGGRQSPFDTPEMYAAVLAAAQKYGVDPRVLLAWTKDESGNGTTSSASLNAINNFGGIQFANQPGASDAGFAEPGHSRNFAAFNTLQDFFNALAANLSTDNYRSLYDRGDLIGVSKQYAESPGTRVQDYADYATRYPASDAAGGGAALDTARFQKALGDGSAAGLDTSAILAAARKHLDELTQIDGQPWYEWCEKFVGNAVQEATGVNYRPHTADEHVRNALAGVPGAGRVIPQSQAMPGDLVGWTSASTYAGSAEGHIGIYSGNNNYIGTTRQGIQERPIGPDAIFIRPDGVVAGGPEPGTTIYKAGGNIANIANAAGIAGAAGGIDARLTVAAGADIPGAAAPSALDAKTATFFGRLVQAMQRQALAPFPAAVQRAMAASDPRDASASIGMFQSVLPILDKRAQATGGPGGGPAITEQERIDASNAALQKGLGFLAAWDGGLTAIRDKTGDVATFQQKITDIIGGPMAAHLNRQLSVMADQAAIADRIAQLTQRKADLEASHAAVLQQRQREDTAESRAMTRQGWADQDAQAALARRSNIENARFTAISRAAEDRARRLAFEQQVQATDLQNKLTDLQKSQQSTVYQRTAAETLLGAQAKGAGTNQAAAVLSARLAAMHEQDLAQKDLNTKAIDDIQLQIREQAKAANLESYNLEGERIAAQRKHEDILQGITDEGIREQDLRTTRDRGHQQDLWNIEDTRAAEDNRYNLAITSIDKEIAAQQQLAADADASLKAAQDALSIWEQTGIDVGQVGTALSNTASQLINAAQQAAYYSSVAGLSTDTGVPYSQFPAPGASQYAGGTGGMYVTSGLVGDSPTGDTSNAEWVVGNFRVYSHADTVRMGKVGGARYAGGTAKPVAPASPAGGGNVFHFGDLIAGGNVTEDQIDGIVRQFRAELRQAVRGMRRSGTDARRAGGG